VKVAHFFKENGKVTRDMSVEAAVGDLRLVSLNI
jgi:hypothetical protein